MRSLPCLILASALGAAALIPAARAQTPESSAALQRAVEYEQAGDLPGALRQIDGLLEKMPSNADFHFWRARLLREQQQFEPAIASYQRGIMIDPSKLNLALWNIAYSQARWSESLETQGDPVGALKRLDEATALLERLNADPSAAAVLRDVDPKRTLRSFKERQGTLAAAIKQGDAGAARDAVARAERLFSRGMLEAASRELLVASELDPALAVAWKDMSRCLMAMGEFQEAADAARKAIELDPTFKEAHNNLGVCLDELDKRAEAIKAFEKALELDPKYVLAMNNMGETLQRMEKPAEAQASYLRALKADPQNATALYNLAGIALIGNQYDEGLKYCRRLLDAQPFNLAACTMIGDICMILGRPDDAAVSYRQALLIAPDNATIKEDLAKAIAKRDSVLIDKYFDASRFGPGIQATEPIVAVPIAPTPVPVPALPTRAPTPSSGSEDQNARIPVPTPFTRPASILLDDRTTSFPMVFH